MTEREAALKAARDWLPILIPYYRIDPSDLANFILAQRREAKIEVLKWAVDILEVNIFEHSFLHGGPTPILGDLESEIIRLEAEQRAIDAARGKS